MVFNRVFELSRLSMSLFLPLFRMIMVNGSGWESFDVTKAVKQWQKHPVKFMSITLELRIEGSRPGRAAAEIARMVRFTGQRSSSRSPRRPELVVFTEEEERIK